MYIYIWYSATFWVEKSVLHKKKNIFIKMGRVSSPVCREHVYIGRLYTGINNSIFKKSNAMSCQ